VVIESENPTSPIPKPDTEPGSSLFSSASHPSNIFPYYLLNVILPFWPSKKPLFRSFILVHWISVRSSCSLPNQDVQPILGFRIFTVLTELGNTFKSWNSSLCNPQISQSRHPSCFHMLFNDAFSVENLQRWLRGRHVNDELERIWEEAVVTEPIYYPRIYWVQLGKTTKTSVRTSGVSDGIRTEHLSNTNLDIYL
jgi:hypothetical protein